MWVSYSTPFLSLEVLVCILELFLIYFFYKLSSYANAYQLVGYTSLWLLSSASYLFYLQFDVFACFLLVSESIVLLFALSIILHGNITNLQVKTSSKLLLFLTPLLVSVLSTCNVAAGFKYWVDWYLTSSTSFNDLLPQYLYFYNIDQWVAVLIAVWLFILTLLVVQLILSLVLGNTTQTLDVSYSRKTQDIWAQWYIKPVTRFFQK